MSARDPITADGIARALIGVTPGDWNAVQSSIKRGGTIVAPTGIVGGVRNEADLQFLTRAPKFVEWLLAENRRLARELDEATRTEDEPTTFGEEMADAAEEH